MDKVNEQLDRKFQKVILIIYSGHEDEYATLKTHDYKKDLETRERKAREERNKEKHYKTSGR